MELPATSSFSGRAEHKIWLLRLQALEPDANPNSFQKL
jgi:hypothetical protein